MSTSHLVQGLLALCLPLAQALAFGLEGTQGGAGDLWGRGGGGGGREKKCTLGYRLLGYTDYNEVPAIYRKARSSIF